MENKINMENFTNSAKRFKAKKVILSEKPEVKDKAVEQIKTEPEVKDKTVEQIKTEPEVTKSEDRKNTHVNRLKRSRSFSNFGLKCHQL